MNAKEFIKGIINKFRKPRQKLLSGTVDNNFSDKRKEFKERNKVEVLSYIDTEESLEECILEYISQYIKQIEIGTTKNISYRAFTRLFCANEDEKGENVEKQQRLKDRINKSNRYRIDGQYSSSGKPIFYHISQNTPESQKITDKNQDMTRIYLNCERKNIAVLTSEILKKLDKIDKCAFKMKFMAESDELEKSKRYQRNEKIVIYVDDDLSKEKVINCLIELKNEEPNLFSNKKKLPLMPKINGFIGCTKQGDSIVSTPLYEVKYADTYNNKLATIMEDCMISSIREISARDSKLVFMMEGYYGEDPKEYLNVFRIMNPDQIQQVVELFKQDFITSCEKSEIDIEFGKGNQSQQR